MLYTTVGIYESSVNLTGRHCVNYSSTFGGRHFNDVAGIYRSSGYLYKNSDIADI